MMGIRPTILEYRQLYEETWINETIHRPDSVRMETYERAGGVVSVARVA